MNLILLTATEAAAEPVRLRGPRAEHIHRVLRAQPGDDLRVGVLDGPLGTGVVVEVAPDATTLRCRFEATPPPRGDDTLLLAYPRPKVLRRCLSLAACLGFARVVLFRSWRVDKSHLQTKILEPDALRAHLVDGLAQGRRTHVPDVHEFARFKPFVEDQLEALIPKGPCFVGHPTGAVKTADVRLTHEQALAPLALAIGPEGGFLPYEVDAFAARGFRPVAAGEHPLRVEAAISYLAGQLTLIREQAQRSE